MILHNSFILISIGLLAGSAVLLLWSQSSGEQARLEQRLALLRGPAPSEAAMAGARLTGFEKLLTTGAKDRAELSAALHAAGYDSASAVAVFGLVRLAAVLGCAGGVALYGLATGMPRNSLLLYAVCGAAVGFLLAKTVLRTRASAGTRRMNKEMPFLLDLLLLLLESGISLDQAFRYLVQQRIGGVERTQRTLTALVDDLQKGMDYDLALDRWATRLGVFGARDLAALLKQSLVYGAEIGPSLRDYVREFSDRRLALARGAAGRQTTMMTMVMVLFLMPAVMIMLAGPSVVAVKATLAQVSARHGTTAGFSSTLSGANK
jgi:tight adherence protein C